MKSWRVVAKLCLAATLVVAGTYLQSADGVAGTGPGGTDAVVAAARGEIHLNPASRPSVTRAFVDVYLPALETGTNWRFGDTDGCRAGYQSSKSHTAQLALINFFRDYAGGLDPVSTTQAMNRKAQQAALMMDAANALSHTPAPDWPCFSKAGAAGAAGANLASTDGTDAIVHYMWDHGSANLDVGHRRWLLHPATTNIGLGSTRSAQAMFVTDIDRYWDSPETDEDFVSWPPAGFVPQELVYPRWSFSAVDADADLSRATVEVNVDHRSLRGETRVAAKVVHRYQGATLGPTVVFEPDLSAPAGVGDFPADPKRNGPQDADVIVTVRVSNMIVDDLPTQRTYRVRIIDTRCLGRQPTLVGTNGDDRLIGTSGDDVIVAHAGDDVVRSGAGNDLICGGGGADSIQGGAGDDFILGGAGQDRLVGGPGNDVLSGSAGRDRLIGQAGTDWLDGGQDNDRLWGGAGKDVLTGGTGTDALHPEPPAHQSG